MKLIKKYCDLIILTIIWIVSIYSIIIMVFESYNIVIQNYIGYGLLVVLSVLRFFEVKKFKTILGIFLIVGAINLIQFTYSTTSIVLSWTPLDHRFTSFGIQPLCSTLLVLFLIINFSEVIHLLTD